MQTGVKVQDIMTRKPITIDKDSTIERCAQLMGERKVNSLIVKDITNKVLGIIVDEDLVRKAIAVNLNCKKIKVEELMSKEITTIEPERDIHDAVKLMGDNSIRQLPVVANKKLVGFITAKDILRIQPALFEIIKEKIRMRREEIGLDGNI